LRSKSCSTLHLLAMTLLLFVSAFDLVVVPPTRLHFQVLDASPLQSSSSITVLRLICWKTLIWLCIHLAVCQFEVALYVGGTQDIQNSAISRIDQHLIIAPMMVNLGSEPIEPFHDPPGAFFFCPACMKQYFVNIHESGLGHLRSISIFGSPRKANPCLTRENTWK